MALAMIGGQTVYMLARAFVLLTAMSHLVPVEYSSRDSLASGMFRNLDGDAASPRARFLLTLIFL